MKMKKLTALISAVMLAVCAVPMGAGAENLMGDMNSNGVIDRQDGNLLYEYVQYKYRDENCTDEEHEFYQTYGDLNGDGSVDDDDVLLLGELNSDITKNTELGDVNHDSFINLIDTTAIMLYYADLSTDQYDKYTQEQHENIRTYGDMNNDGIVNAVDATFIAVTNKENSMGDLNRNGVIDEEDGNLLVKYWQWERDDDSYSDEYHKFYRTYGDLNGDGRIDNDDVVAFSENYADSDITLNTEMGDINHDGYVNAVDATLILVRYADMSTGKEDNYTEAQQENFEIYGDMNGDGFVNAIDTTEILIIYAERSTSVF